MDQTHGPGTMCMLSNLWVGWHSVTGRFVRMILVCRWLLAIWPIISYVLFSSGDSPIHATFWLETVFSKKWYLASRLCFSEPVWFQTMIQIKCRSIHIGTLPNAWNYSNITSNSNPNACFPSTRIIFRDLFVRFSANKLLTDSGITNGRVLFLLAPPTLLGVEFSQKKKTNENSRDYKGWQDWIAHGLVSWGFFYYQIWVNPTFNLWCWWIITFI